MKAAINIKKAFNNTLKNKFIIMKYNSSQLICKTHIRFFKIRCIIIKARYFLLVYTVLKEIKNFNTNLNIQINIFLTLIFLCLHAFLVKLNVFYTRGLKVSKEFIKQHLVILYPEYK